jgi:PucR-like helix-turn-helix protein
VLDTAPGDLDAVAEVLLARAEVLVEAQLVALRAFAGYDRVPHPELRKSARRNVLRVAAVLHGRTDLPPEADENERSSGRQRALQGIPAEEVVGAYRAVMGVLREEFLAAAERLGTPVQDILAATRLLWDLTDRYSTELVAARRQIDIEVARRDERARLAFLQRLLTGALLPTEVLVGGLAYGVAPDVGYWVCRGRQLDQHRPTLARNLEVSGASAHFHPLIGAIDGDLVAVTARRPTVAVDDAVLAVAGPVVPAAFPAAFAEATRLLNVALRYQRHGLVDGASLSVRIAVVEESELSEALAARYVAPVLATGATAGILLDSVRTYLARRRHVGETAVAMSVHPNTVRYRLARYTEITGADLEDTETLIEVWWALESWVLHQQDPPVRRTLK